jgi:predicted acetyltransferase
MNIEIVKVLNEDKDILWNLLQFALYDGSFYVDNKINEKGVFEYKWFDNYFTDNDRLAYFIKQDNNILGFFMINSNLKVKHDCPAQTIAEFLILPQYRKKHIGKIAAYKIFDTFIGEWEVEPMNNNVGAYEFWKKIISEYSNNNYKIYKLDNIEEIFVFKSKC